MSSRPTLVVRNEFSVAAKTVHPPSRQPNLRLIQAPSNTVANAQTIENLPDNELLLREKKGLDVLWRRHFEKVFRYTLRICKDHAMAEDITSDVFLDIFKSMKGECPPYEGRSSVTTWILAIAKFKTLSTLRSRREVTGEEFEMAANALTAPDTPHDILEKVQESETVRRALAKLSREHREVINHMYFHDRTVEEITQILRIPENTTKTRAFYARQYLTEALKKLGFNASGYRPRQSQRTTATAGATL